MTSIVIPAHDEERVIGRLLDALTAGQDERPDIVVVCNGCTDGTARVAAGYPGVRVVEIPEPSKHAALLAGDAHAAGFPLLHVDADVVVTAADARALAGVVADGGPVLAAAPGRDVPLAGCAWPVRAYYRVWQRLPAVREGLFGRGVIALSRQGHARIAALPPLMADDLAASLAFAPAERRVVRSARVTVLPPRTWADLIRRRVRAHTSTAQLELHQAGSRPAQDAPAPSARTTPADLLAVLRARPWLLPHLAVFLTAAVVARRKAERAVRERDFGTWLRDESSRAGGDAGGAAGRDPGGGVDGRGEAAGPGDGGGADANCPGPGSGPDDPGPGSGPGANDPGRRAGTRSGRDGDTGGPRPGPPHDAQDSARDSAGES